MNKYFLFFASLIFLFSSAQENDVVIIDYQYTFVPKSIGFSSVRHSKLTVNDSVFELKLDKPIASYGSYNTSRKSEFIIMTGFINKPVIFKYGSSRDTYSDRVVKDVLPEINWVITSERKKIMKYDCIKATATFRGSEIIAYFTPEIPIQLGPYKFRGLPGLILQVNSKDEEHIWQVNSIKSDIAEKYPLHNSFEFHNVITLQDEIKETDKIIEEYNKRQKARVMDMSQNEGVSTIESSFTYVRPGIEKVYEWELEDEKD